MAKLSAHGTELIRLSRTTDSRHSGGVETRRSTVVLMSDRVVLEKIDVTFPNTFSGGTRVVSRGWRVIGRNVRQDVTIDQFAAVYEARGYTREGV